jgi:hypothetical protein
MVSHIAWDENVFKCMLASFLTTMRFKAVMVMNLSELHSDK